MKNQMNTLSALSSLNVTKNNSNSKSATITFIHWEVQVSAGRSNTHTWEKYLSAGLTQLGMANMISVRVCLAPANHATLETEWLDDKHRKNKNLPRMSLTLVWLVWVWPVSGGWTGGGLERSVVPETGEDRDLQGQEDRGAYYACRVNHPLTNHTLYIRPTVASSRHLSVAFTRKLRH